VQEALVAPCGDDSGERRLVAYVVLKPGQADAPRELRSLLEQRLPDYMLPSAFVTLDKLPLTHNGKVDRAALPAPDFEHQLKEAFVPPRTEWELRLAHIWQELLRVERVGVDDNFFALGGDSLMVVRLISQINQSHQLSLGVAEAFRNPTVGQLARLIDAQQPRSKRQPAVVQLRKGQTEPRVYFIYAGPDEFRLAKLMDGRHAVFGIEVPWPLAWRNAVAANRRTGFPTMEQLVAPYVAALSAHTGASPCVLAGHSFAGLMAFEAAHQFLRQGGKVEMVMLLDAVAKFPIPHQVAWHRWRQDWTPTRNGLSTPIISRLSSSWHTTRWLLRQERHRVWSYFNRLVVNPNQLTHVLDEDGMPLPWTLLDRLYVTIGKPYPLRRLDSRGILFRTDPMDGDTAVRAFDDSLGWNNLFTRGLQVVPMAGDHLSMIRDHNATLAREINEVLKRHCSTEPDKGSIHAHEPQRLRPAQSGAIVSMDPPHRLSRRQRH
jgi:thioesterase domain-containing protein/acyl carrier protein